MAPNEPIDPVVRLAISQWPDDAPRGAVSTFCVEHGISRKSFYALRKRAQVDGQAAVLEPRSRRPRSSPSKLTDQVKVQAIAVRAALEASGLDHGPISVHDKMASMGLPVVPSTAALARMFRETGVARLEPRKKPRAATADLPANLPAGTVVRKLSSLGTFGLNSVRYAVDARRAFEHVLITQNEDQITVIDLNGEVLLETTRPAPGTTYVGRTTQNPEPSPKS